MTKPSIRSTRHNPQHSGTPRKTKLIKFRVTEQEKLELELLCKLLRVNMSTLIRGAMRQDRQQSESDCPPLQQRRQRFRTNSGAALD